MLLSFNIFVTQQVHYFFKHTCCSSKKVSSWYGNQRLIDTLTQFPSSASQNMSTVPSFLLRIYFNLPSHVHLCLSTVQLHSGVTITTMYFSPLPYKLLRTIYLICLHLVITVSFTHKKLWSSPVNKFIHPPFTSSVLGPNVFLITFFLKQLW